MKLLCLERIMLFELMTSVSDCSLLCNDADNGNCNGADNLCMPIKLTIEICRVVWHRLHLQVQQQEAGTGRKRRAETDNDDAELARSLAKRKKSFGIADFDEGMSEACAHASQDAADAELLAVRAAITEAFAVDDDDVEEEAIEAAPAQQLLPVTAALRAPWSSRHVP